MKPAANPLTNATRDLASAGSEITEHTVRTARHTTGYLRSGPTDGPLVIFCHGWPELSRSWRHQLRILGGLGLTCVAPDMRGYGNSSVYATHDAYQQEFIVADMIELIDQLQRPDAVWVGHDWGSPVVWNLAAHHPDRVRAVASLCVPYFPEGFVLDQLVNYVDRSIYPEADFPAGQWDYMYYYLENFEAAQAACDANPGAMIRAMFRRAGPEGVDQPSFTASIRQQGGWFGGGPVPDLPQDYRVLSDVDHAAYTAALVRKGFFGPNSWYMNHAANAAYAAAAPSSRLTMPVLFLHARYDQILATVGSQLVAPMRAECDQLSEVIVDSGHWMAQEQPLAVNAALTRWLIKSVPDSWPGPSTASEELR